MHRTLVMLTLVGCVFADLDARDEPVAWVGFAETCRPTSLWAGTDDTLIGCNDGFEGAFLVDDQGARPVEGLAFQRVDGIVEMNGQVYLYGTTDMLAPGLWRLEGEVAAPVDLPVELGGSVSSFAMNADGHQLLLVGGVMSQSLYENLDGNWVPSEQEGIEGVGLLRGELVAYRQVARQTTFIRHVPNGWEALSVDAGFDVHQVAIGNGNIALAGVSGNWEPQLAVVEIGSAVSDASITHEVDTAELARGTPDILDVCLDDQFVVLVGGGSYDRPGLFVAATTDGRTIDGLADPYFERPLVACRVHGGRAFVVDDTGVVQSIGL